MKAQTEAPMAVPKSKDENDKERRNEIALSAMEKIIVSSNADMGGGALALLSYYIADQMMAVSKLSPEQVIELAKKNNDS